MARDRASLRIDIWADQDWRDLSHDAQWLYELLLSHPSLNYAGVAEWRPGRLAAMASDLSTDDVLRFGAELVSRFFIVIDEGTEEVLIRSYLKHDGLMKQPKLVVSMMNAFAGVASRTLREVIAFEAQKLHEREPDLRAWDVAQAGTLLRAPATDAHTLGPTVTPLFTPGVTPAVTPNGGQAQGLRTSTSTSTSTKRESAANRGTRLSEDWVPTPELVAWGKREASGVDLKGETFKFVNYWTAKAGKDAVKLDWGKTWQNWILRVRGNVVAAQPKKRFTAHVD